MKRMCSLLLSGASGLAILTLVRCEVSAYAERAHTEAMAARVKTSSMLPRPRPITSKLLAQCGATGIPSGYHFDSIEFDNAASNQFSFSMPVSSIEIGVPGHAESTWGFMVSPDGQKWYFANKPDAEGVAGNVVLIFKNASNKVLVAKGPTVTCPPSGRWIMLPIKLQGNVLVMKGFTIRPFALPNLKVELYSATDELQRHAVRIKFSGPVPYGYSLVQLKWKSGKRTITETYQQLIGSSKYFYITGDGEFMGFIYGKSMVGETGQIFATFADSDGHTFVAASPRITLK